MKNNSFVTVVVIISGLIIGLINVFGNYSLIGINLFLMGLIVIVMLKKSYHYFVILGFLLLSCVFIEPSPSDLILCSAIPLGLISGIYKPQIQSKGLVAICIFIAYFIASLPGIANSDEHISSLVYYLITFFLFAIALFICTYGNKKNISSLLRAYVFAAFFSFLAGLLGYLGIFSDLLMADPLRVKGLFKDPNVFGPFFLPAIIILINDIKNKIILRSSAIVHLLMILMLSLGIVFSFSRGAWINLGVSVLVYYILNLGSFNFAKHMKVIFLIITVIFATGLLLLYLQKDNTGIFDFMQQRAKIQDYDSNRFDAQRGGLILITRNPFGYGTGQFENEIVKITNFRLSAHSLYIRTAVENGVLGFLFFIAALIYILLQLLSNHRKFLLDQKTHKMIVTLESSVPFSIITGLLVNSLVVDTIHWRHFWVFIGIGLYCINNKTAEIGEKKGVASYEIVTNKSM